MSKPIAPRMPGHVGMWTAGALFLLGVSHATAAEVTTEENTGDEVVLDTVVVTGSHVRKDAFTSASPIQVITREGSVLAGLSSTSDVLQGSTVSGGGQQINNYFGSYVVDGGPGVNTLSLRGLGAVRTLVLLNGRRLAPAGTRGSVGSADLNVLPSAIVDRIEILKDGASSTYGSDAVAGVVNIITKNGVNDFTVEAHRNSTFDGGGNTTTFSLSGGRSSDRGQLLGSIEYYERSNLAVGQRDWASCPTQVLIDPQTGEYDPDFSILNEDGSPRCFPISSLDGVASGIAHNYIVAPICELPDYDPCLFLRATPDDSVTTPIPGWRGVDPLGDRPGFDRRQLNDSLISPTKNYTAFLSGAYDTGALGNGELYFEAAYHRRESKQIGSRQLSLDYQVGDDFSNHPFVPDAIYAPGPGLDWGGVAINDFGNYVIARAFSFFGNDVSRQTADFSRLVTGLRGNLTFAGDWTYDINATINRSDGSYTFESALNDRVNNAMYVTQVAPGFNGPTRVGFDGLTYTCEVNVTTPGSGCVPVPLLDEQYLGSNIPQDYRDYIWHDITGNTLYKESTISAIANGALLDLPYGRLRGAIGAEVRWMSINDVPDDEMLNGNLYAFSSAGITRGKDSVQEVFGELDIPLLAGVTGAEDLTLNLSARYTDYDSYGSDTTHKIGLNYTPVGWVRLRATTGTSYRAPAIFEQFLSPTSGFLPQETDPCHLYGDLPPSSFVYINCAAEGLPANFIQASGVEVNSAGGAATGLQSEDSRANTVGIILQPPLPATAGDLSFAIDWWKIKVDNQVSQIGGGNLLNLCYGDPDFRAGGSYCAFSVRDENDELKVDDNYLNIASQTAAGLDFNLRYVRDLGLGEFTADLRTTRYTKQQSRLLPTDPIDKYNGTVTAPRWVGDMDLRYEWKNWTAYYGLIYVGTQDSNDYLEVDPAVDPYNFRASAYMTHNLSMQYEGADDWEVIVGVRNLTDATPKTVTPGFYSNRVGNSFLYSGYDYFGRRAFVTLAKTF
ncbi:MAG TPA: TonB-dependent receptor [Steroidobacteraceae bacterium]|nr:TonB-dependent receptor [Steroidobacteraceae bacterium]